MAPPVPDEERDAVRRNVEIVVAAFTGSDGSAPAPPVVRMRQVHGADVHVVDRPAAEPRARATALVTAEPGVVLMVRVADCVPVLLADPDAGVVGAAHAGRPGLVAGVVAGAPSRAMRELGRRPRSRAWVGPARVRRAATRCPSRCGPRWRRVVPAAVADDLVGHAGARPRRRGRAPSSTRAGVDGRRRVAAARARTPTCYSYRRDGAARRPARRPGRGCGRDRRPPRRDRGRTSTPCASASPAACARRRPRRRRGDAGRGHQVLPRLRRAAARRPRRHATWGRTATRRPRPRPPSAPTSTCAGTSSAGCRATRRPPSRRTPTSSSPSTGAKLRRRR